MKTLFVFLSDSQITKIFLLIFISLFIPFYGCEKEDQKPVRPETEIDSTAIKDSLEKIEEKINITYHYFPEEGKTNYKKLKGEFGVENAYIILALNRLDINNMKSRDSLVVPDTLIENFLVYSPFPEKLDAAGSVKRLILFSHKIQAFAAYEYGMLVRWGPTSLGKKSTPTPNGLFHTNWKAKKTISTINEEWILPWAFNLDNFDGVSMHEFDLPGYPASHACARLLQQDAQWFYYWAEQWIVTDDQEKIIAYGTPVIIYDKYNFGKKPPWHFLPQNPDTTNVPVSLLEEVLDEYIPTIINRQTKRDYIDAERDSIKTSVKR